MQKMLDREQQYQEAHYEFPYHYIPMWTDNRFSQVRYWTSGLGYIGRIKFVFDQLEKRSFDSLIDIGCGDGRFLGEVAKRYRQVRLLGVDYSQRAIKLAEAMNPDLDYKTIDIVKETLVDRFEVATVIEVLEHIPPEQTDRFLRGVANTLREHGRLILTVPHANRKVANRHYQHFDSDRLREVLEPYFRDIDFILLQPASRVMGVIARLIGGKGNHFIITNPRLLFWIYRLYIRRYLYTDDEQKCGGIAAICGKR
jgi:cyclopropane fatty-acyl-phospholipid synthase-like methyltransferase